MMLEEESKAPLDHSLGGVLKRNPISFFAVLCIAAIGIFLGYLIVWHTNVLSSEGWCAKSIMAEKISPGSSFVGLTTCTELLKIQLQAMALNSHIMLGSYSFMIVVLMVVVVARAKASANLPGGVSFNVAGEGETAVPSVPVTVTNPPSAPVPVSEKPAAPAPTIPVKPNPNYSGPAMPEPKP